jgi:hypothetical protein
MPHRAASTARRASAVLCAFLVALGLASTTATAASRYTITTRQLAPGLVWKSIVDSVGPNHINALIVTPSQALSLDTASATPTMAGNARTSAMATAHKALAGINGDFGASDGRPTHPFMDDGDLRVSGDHTGDSFALSQDELSAFFGQPDLQISADSGTGPVKVAEWNPDAIGDNQLDGYSTAGGTMSSPPGNACSVRLLPASGLAWGPSMVGLVQTFSVDAVQCSSSALARNGGTVLSTPLGSYRADWVRSLVKGQHVTITKSFGWPDVLDVISGAPMLLQNGVNVAPSSCWDFCDAQPRSGVGATSGCFVRSTSCQIILAVVDGRRRGYSVGMTLPAFGAVFKMLGATTAMNFDGGGSTTMWIKGYGVVNRPTDSTGERPVPNSLLVLRTKDPSDPAL